MSLPLPVNVLISVALPTFNSSKTIEQTLESVKEQTFHEWECIVVDDGSTDNTPDIARSWTAKDGRFKFIQRKQQPKGPSSCRNIGWQHGQGEYVIFLDSDDILAPFCLERRIKAMKSLPERVCFCVWPCRNMFSSDIHQAKPACSPISGLSRIDLLFKLLRKEPVWQTTAPMWRKSFLERVGGFSTNETYPFDDPDLHARALLNTKDYMIFYDAPPDYYYRTSALGEPRYPPKKLMRMYSNYPVFLENVLNEIKEVKFDTSTRTLHMAVLEGIVNVNEHLLQHVVLSTIRPMAKINRRFADMGIISKRLVSPLYVASILFALKLNKVKGSGAYRYWNWIKGKIIDSDTSSTLYS